MLGTPEEQLGAPAGNHDYLELTLTYLRPPYAHNTVQLNPPRSAPPRFRFNTFCVEVSEKYVAALR